MIKFYDVENPGAALSSGEGAVPRIDELVITSDGMTWRVDDVVYYYHKRYRAIPEIQVTLRKV